jgi:dihydrofolate synthase/folylpolyglutamate synthase
VSYERALRHLDRHVNLEAKAGRWEGLSLDRIRSLMHVMGDPHLAYPVIHVTGTNGKGSTTLMITELLKARGLHVGTYTSPHLERVNERIRLDGEPLDDDAFGHAVNQVAGVEPLVDETLSYFEVLTGAAFDCFAEHAVDVAVVEVGLLGRWDATNVVEAEVAVVTNIGRDHTDGQGDWRRAIALEKAGIIKPSSTLVLGETSRDLREIFLAEPAAGVFERGVHFDVMANRVAVGGRAADLQGPYGRYEDVFIALHGAHQADNAVLAVAATEAFFASALEDDVVREALAAVKVPGRFEILHRQPMVVLDAAHNPDGALVAAETLDEDFGVGRRRILVVGLLQGRDIGDMLDALGADRAEVVIVCEADWPRRIPAEEIAAVAAARGIEVEVVKPIEDAVRRALALAESDDVVLITGSTYIIGPARRVLLETNAERRGTN